MKEKGIAKLYIAVAIVSTTALGMTAPVFAYEDIADVVTEQISDEEMPAVTEVIEEVEEVEVYDIAVYEKDETADDGEGFPEVEVDTTKAAEDEQPQILIDSDKEENEVQESRTQYGLLDVYDEVPEWLTEEEYIRLVWGRTPEEYKSDREALVIRGEEVATALEEARLSGDEELIAAAEENYRKYCLDASFILKYVLPVEIAPEDSVYEYTEPEKDNKADAEEKTDTKPEILIKEQDVQPVGTESETEKAVEIIEVQEARLLSAPQTGDDAPIYEVMFVMFSSMMALGYGLKKLYNR